MWIPRGRIYHTIPQSLKYLVWTFFSPVKIRLDDRLGIEKSFAEYIGVEHCRVFPFARTALYFSLKALNLPRGCKILMPPITIKPMLDVVYSLNLVPVFVDLSKENFAFDLDDLESKITPDAKVLLLTYLFGCVPDMQRVNKIVKENSLYLIEDFSQALGAMFQGKKLGGFGTVSVYSASSIKTLDSLGGGFAVTNDNRIAASLSESQSELGNPKRSSLVKKALSNLMRNVVTLPVIFSLFTSHVLKFLRTIDQKVTRRMTGSRSLLPLIPLPTEWFFNYSNIQCRIAKEQMIELDQKLNLRIKKARSMLEVNNTEVAPTQKLDVYWQLCMLSENIDEVFSKAIKHKIDISQTSLSLISENSNYPDSLHCVNANYIYYNSFFVPCYPQLTNSQLFRLRDWVRDIR